MKQPKTYFEYLEYNGAELFTMICLPDTVGTYPTVIYRSPYVDEAEEMTEEELCANAMRDFKPWTDNEYVFIFQHCRGRGKSSGDCIPYINEREDGLFLQDWIRKQSFYSGEIYLCGASYTSTVHLVTAPFADDIKGAVLETQDCERYNCNYRNGFYKMGLHGWWYVGMYKHKSHLKQNYTASAYHTLPLSDFSKIVFDEEVPDFDEILKHPDKNDDFWNTRYGGGEAHEAIKHANIPILLTTGIVDIYTGGLFDMWNGLDEQTKAKSALVVHPYDHSPGDAQPIQFEGGFLPRKFGNYPLNWINSIRGKGESPFERGKVTYYKVFANEWCCDTFYDATRTRVIPLGSGEVTYRYNPYDPATFQGGLSANFGGAAWQDPPNSRYDIISLYTPEFTEDTFIKGKMKAKLRVKSTCEDTCFYVRISLCKTEGDYGIRDDITQISNFSKEYVPGDKIEIDFAFDEHAIVAQKGEKLRIDISSSADPFYVRHTNNRGLFSEQTTAKIADNTVYLDESYLEIPIA